MEKVQESNVRVEQMGAEFVAALLDAITKDHLQRIGTANGGNSSCILPETSQAVTSELDCLANGMRKLTGPQLANVVIELSSAIHFLRSRYSRGVGLLLLKVLEQMSLWQKSSRAMNVLLALVKLVDGIILLCTVRHAQEEAGRVLKILLEKRAFPKVSWWRMEAACVSIDVDKLSLPRMPRHATTCNQWFVDYAKTLQPNANMRAKLSRAQKTVEMAFYYIFPGARVEYYGSAVNGFETFCSDLDCHVQLDKSSQAKIAQHSGKEIYGQSSDKILAVMAAEFVAHALRSDCHDIKTLCLEVTTVITDARVPLVKCIDRKSVV